MNAIIRGTTPTIKYTFNDIEVSDITAAYLTVKMSKQTLLEKDITAATIDEGFIAWTFTQAETISMTADHIHMQLNWKLSDGTRGASKDCKVYVVENMKEVVI